MMKTIGCLLFCWLMAPCVAGAGELDAALNRIEAQWAKIYYGLPDAEKGAAYTRLLEVAAQLSAQHPGHAGAMFWRATIMANNANYQSGVTALHTIHEVRDLLQKTIAMDPSAMGGGAYVVLGTLYHKAPAWPIAFGDDDEAERLLQTGVKVNPNGIDTNFFYGEFLLDQDNLVEAERFFERALKAPIRPEQVFADTELKKIAVAALKNIRGKKISCAGDCR